VSANEAENQVEPRAEARPEHVIFLCVRDGLFNLK